MERWLHQHIFKVGWLITQNFQTTTILYYTFFLPGVLLHELVYWLVAGALNTRAERAITWPEPQEIGELKLNFVKINPETPTYKKAIITAAPLLIGLTIIWWVANNIFDLSAAFAVMSSGNVDDVSAGFQLLFGVPDFWLWVYLTFTISNTMYPTIPEDLRGWRIAAGAVGIISAVLVILGVGSEILSNVAQPLSIFLQNLHGILVFIILINFLMVMGLGTIEYIIERITDRNVTFRDGQMVTMTRAEAIAEREQAIEAEREAERQRREAARMREESKLSLFDLPLPIPADPETEGVTQPPPVILGLAAEQEAATKAAKEKDEEKDEEEKQVAASDETTPDEPVAPPTMPETAKPAPPPPPETRPIRRQQEPAFNPRRTAEPERPPATQPEQPDTSEAPASDASSEPDFGRAAAFKPRPSSPFTPVPSPPATGQAQDDDVADKPDVETDTPDQTIEAPPKPDTKPAATIIPFRPPAQANDKTGDATRDDDETEAISERQAIHSPFSRLSRPAEPVKEAHETDDKPDATTHDDTIADDNTDDETAVAIADIADDDDTDDDTDGANVEADDKDLIFTSPRAMRRDAESFVSPSVADDNTDDVKADDDENASETSGDEDKKDEDKKDEDKKEDDDDETAASPFTRRSASVSPFSAFNPPQRTTQAEDKANQDSDIDANADDETDDEDSGNADTLRQAFRQRLSRPTATGSPFKPFNNQPEKADTANDEAPNTNQPAASSRPNPFASLPTRERPDPFSGLTPPTGKADIAADEDQDTEEDDDTNRFRQRFASADPFSALRQPSPDDADDNETDDDTETEDDADAIARRRNSGRDAVASLFGSLGKTTDDTDDDTDNDDEQGGSLMNRLGGGISSRPTFGASRPAPKPGSPFQFDRPQRTSDNDDDDIVYEDDDDVYYEDDDNDTYTGYDDAGYDDAGYDDE